MHKMQTFGTNCRLSAKFWIVTYVFILIIIYVNRQVCSSNYFVIVFSLSVRNHTLLFVRASFKEGSWNWERSCVSVPKVGLNWKTKLLFSRYCLRIYSGDSIFSSTFCENSSYSVFAASSSLLSRNVRNCDFFKFNFKCQSEESYSLLETEGKTFLFHFVVVNFGKLLYYSLLR
jgi:hypothetical protein